MIIDSHFHIFTKDLMGRDTAMASRMLSLIEQMGSVLPSDPIRSPFLDFVNIVLKYDEMDQFLTARAVYGDDFIITPLMFDMSYLMEEAIREEPDEILHGPRARLAQFIRSHLVNPKNYRIQFESLVRLKSRYPDNIFPFYSIDPRQERIGGRNLLEDIQRYVGPDKPFHGVKLYPPAGFSPTDPLLFNPNPKEPTVFSLCQKKQIPITVHYSRSGFACFSRNLEVHGDIYLPQAGEVVPAEEALKEGIVTFQHSIAMLGSTKKAIEERSLTLNHPHLWEKVLTTYPKLYLNLAHMGGPEEVGLFLEKKRAAFLPRRALEMAENYPHVYTDLSCLVERRLGKGYTLEDFREMVYEPMPKSMKSKILYGSDFYLISIFDDNLFSYYEAFNRAFGDEMERIAYQNPQKFLFKRSLIDNLKTFQIT